jgi:gamma-glutamylcysteine synthetase
MTFGWIWKFDIRRRRETISGERQNESVVTDGLEYPEINTSDNNDPNIDYNYHPLLNIPNSEIASNDASYIKLFLV